MSDARRSTRLAGALGAVLGLAALGAVGLTLSSRSDELRDAVDGASLGWLAMGWLLAAIAMPSIALPWRHAVTALGGPLLPRRETVARFFLGEIGKYLPGGAWPIVGRAELAVRRDVPRAVAYGSVGLSLLGLYGAASLVVVAGLPWLVGGDDGLVAAAAVLLLPVVVVVLHPRVLGGAVRLLERLVHRPLDVNVPPLTTSLRLVARYVPAWVVVGAATWTVARALDPEAAFLPVLAAAALSWIVGFLAVPVPGGLGVREAAFVVVASALDPEVAAATALLVRAMLMSIDAAGAVLGAAALRRGSPN